MSNLEPNDRVVVNDGEHRNKHGKVIGGTIYGLIERTYPVQLDNNDNSKIPEAFLEYENLRSDELTEQITNVRVQVNKVADQLPGETGKELPNHLQYLGDAIASKDKEWAGREYNYVAKNLEAASQRGFITKEWMETIRIPFEKLDWAVKRLS
ncbi:hypothetical protein A6S26_05865 [Nostoc sp. ATCC 43529]|nr:hypothetical protein A6S26_05865 [Nostoc sp. ATCC 43529]